MSIIAIWGPPQSGKTTLAIDLAHGLSRHGKSVCLLSPEPYSELTARMNIHITHDKSLAQAYQSLGNLRQIVFEAGDLLYVLAAAWDTDAFEEEPSTSNVMELLQQAEETFDCVLVDCPSGTGNAVAARALNRAAKVVLLSGASGTAAMWYNAFRRPIDVLNGKIVCVCNQVSGNYDYPDLCKLIRQNPDVYIPYFPDIASIQTMKHTLYGSSGRIGKAYTKSLDMLMEGIEVTAQ